MSEGARPNIVLIGSLVGIVALAGAQFYTITNLRAVESKLAAVETEQAKAKESVDAEVAKAQQAANGDAAERDKALAAVREQVELARNQARDQARAIVGQVKQETGKSVQELNSRIAANEQKVQETHAELSTELTGLKQATATATTEIAVVSTEVRDVRDQIADTRSELGSTIADLKRVTGDLGVMSGLIATNGSQIDALKQLGDRNYSEFTILKGKNAVRVGDVWVLLKDINPAKNRYTVELRADDRRIDKKDRAVNEPVQFYVGKNRQPHELVVNQVQKNAIVGYLATPKVTVAR